MMPKHFTVKSSGGLLNELLTRIGVSLPASHQKPTVYQTTALWDTGATNSVITTETARKLNLSPISKAKIHHAAGTSFMNVYLVDIYLPNRMIMENIFVTECEDAAGKFGLIVGMDIITRGDFSITNLNGNTVFSFRIPSNHVIDYGSENQ